MAGDPVEEHVEGYEVDAFGNDDVCMLFGGLNVELVHGLDGGEVLGFDGFDGSASFDDVAAQAAQDSDVGVGIDKDFDVAEVPDLGFYEDEDPFEDDNGLGFYDEGVV